MPSLQARFVFLFLKLFWVKQVPAIGQRQKKKPIFLEKLYLSQQPVTTMAKVIEGVHIDNIEPKVRSKKIVVYVHGGGFVYEGTSGHTELVNRLAVAAQATVISVHYKLAPEFQFPTQIHEVERVYLWLLEKGHSAQDIYFAGDSAGGNIILATTIVLRDTKKPLPAGVIAISAPVDGTFSYPSFLANKPFDFILTPEKIKLFIDTYRGKESPSNPLISPTFANLKGLPKMQLFVSDNELPFDDVIVFSKKLQKAGVLCEVNIGKKLMHGYPLVARFVPEARESISLMAKFIKGE